jgi:multicomponent Na+:H+ antiporter subunit D
VLGAGEPLRHFLGGWPPPFGIEYVIDTLSAYMMVIITFIGFVAISFPSEAGLYQTPRKKLPVYGLILLLVTGLSGVVVTGDVFNLFVFLENIFAGQLFPDYPEATAPPWRASAT